MVPAPSQITVNLLTKPFGLPRHSLLFSFAMGQTEENMLLQACRFVFAEGKAALAAQDYLFDTGWLVTGHSSGLKLPGLAEALADDACYVFQLQTRSETGVISDWSEPVMFSTSPEAWCPIGVWGQTVNGRAPDFCFFRREFSLESLPVKALLQVTARSPEKARQYIYHITCNGQHAGLGPARYGKENGRELLYYDVLDITELCKEGQNCIGAACYTEEDHLFAARLVLFDEQGRKTVVFEDAGGFEAMDATPVFRPAGSIGTSYYAAAAENIDGISFPYGWDESFYTGGFLPVALKEYIGEPGALQPYPAPAVKRFCQPAAAMEWAENDVLLIDLGREIVGGLMIQTNSDCQRELTLRYGEELTGAGRVRYQMRTGNIYEEHWRLAEGDNSLSSMGMKTFRYVEITGLPQDVEAEAVTGLAYRTEFNENESYFTSSSELLNAIYDLCKYTIQATNQNLYVDSQSRERRAYEGDVLINMLTAAAVADCHALSRFSIAYLLEHRTWPAEYVLYCILMVRADYEYTGDDGLLKKSYPLLREKLYWNEWDEFTGLLRSYPEAGNTTDAVLVDWPGSERDGYAYKEAAYNTVFNAVHYRALTDLAFLANVLGLQQDCEEYTEKANGLRLAMIDRLYQPETGCFADGLTKEGNLIAHAAQHATAFALYAGVYDSDCMAGRMAAFLASQGDIRMSVYGAFFLLEGLYQAGAGEAANRLLLNDDCSEGARTWAYMLDQLNATITTEAWNTTNKSNMTFSHPWGSAAGSAIVRGLFGIRPLKPGFCEFSLRLQPAGLRYAAVQVPTVKGRILASFDTTLQASSLYCTITVPANTKACITLPGASHEKVYQEDRILATEYKAGTHTFWVGSGVHVFEVR